jgi:hypothetical protein
MTPTEQLEKAFKQMGLSEAGAKIAARGRTPQTKEVKVGPGRGARPEPSSHREAGLQLGLSEAQARTFARGRGRLVEAVRNVAGLTSACFAWTPDLEAPETWQLQIARSDDSGDGMWTPDEDLVRRAVAMVPGIGGFGTTLDIPEGDLPAVKSTLRSAWIAANLPLDEMPFELNQEALRKAFGRLGLSEKAAAVAAEGRGQRW